ncbi:hypothetical protein PALU110988_21550 [Paenibacillus lupini]|uniref:hypothetical protein n=1 Tax=Paenibacillus lupini TaxID=1450204 RepID=UPI001421E2F5|nr:hypothetical protein [Paenibacillus lupini]NIK22884.1 RNA processing factor Prp31 [Paenibacillus lupini]
MPYTITIPDSFFNAEEQTKLYMLFGSTDHANFEQSLNKICLAALTEYKEMLLGKGLPTRADEIKQHRLFHLIVFLFQNTLPNEAEVSSMFQLTESEARALIRNVRTRFRYQLDGHIQNTLRDILQQAALDTTQTEYHVIIQSNNVLEELNRIIDQYGPHLDPIAHVRGSAKKYKIMPDTYHLLQTRLLPAAQTAAANQQHS